MAFVDLVLDEHSFVPRKHHAVDRLEAGELDVDGGGCLDVDEHMSRGPGGGTGGCGEEICEVQCGCAELHHVVDKCEPLTAVDTAANPYEYERTPRQLGLRVGVAGPLPDTGGHDVDAVLGGVGLVFHQHAVIYGKANVVDCLHAA